MAVNSIEAGLGLQGGGVGDVTVAMDPPLSRQNGGTGVSAVTPAQLVNQLGAVPASGGSMGGNLTVAGGIRVGAVGVPAIGTLLINRNPAPPSVPMGSAFVPLHISGNNGENPLCVFDAYDSLFALRFARANGTGEFPTQVRAGDGLGNLAWQGYGASDWVGACARVQCSALEDFTNTQEGSQITISATPVGQGAPVTQAAFGPGLTVGNPTPVAGMQVGDLNAQRIFLNGTSLGGSTGLPLTGGTLYNPGNDTTLTLRADGDQRAEMHFDVAPGVVLPGAVGGSWHTGVGPAGHFAIRCEGLPAPQFVIDANPTTGLVEISRDLHVIGDIIAGDLTPSDRRLKDDVAPFAAGLAAVRRLTPISYKYNGKGGMRADGRTRVSVDAEEAAAAIPEMAGEISWAEIDGSPVKAIRPDALLFALLNSVKEIAGRLDALEADRV